MWVLACRLSISIGVLAACKVCDADTLDSVVASIGNTAITASDVEKEYRFERFMDAQWPAPPADAATMSAVRQRLTYQMLLTREEKPGPAEKESAQQAAAGRVSELREQFGGREPFETALRSLGMTDAELLKRITQQELMLRLINQRLRPEALPSDEDVAAYYQASFVPEFKKLNPQAAAPPLAEVADQIREILIQKRINELLEQWIEDLRPAGDVRFH